jgi:hypothetical protein
MMAFITGHHHHYSGKCCSNFNERSNDNYSFSRMAQKDIKEKGENKISFFKKSQAEQQLRYTVNASTKMFGWPSVYICTAVSKRESL